VPWLMSTRRVPPPRRPAFCHPGHLSKRSFANTLLNCRIGHWTSLKRRGAVKKSQNHRHSIKLPSPFSVPAFRSSRDDVTGFFNKGSKSQ